MGQFFSVSQFFLCGSILRGLILFQTPTLGDLDDYSLTTGVWHLIELN
ncbi:20334_t:CDS:2, partial [Rhizophagus irregularis]